VAVELVGGEKGGEPLERGEARGAVFWHNGDMSSCVLE